MMKPLSTPIIRKSVRMNFLTPWSSKLLSVLRIVSALLFLEHGLQKIFNFPPAAKPRPYELMTLSPGLAGALELVGGILLVIGLFSRPVAFILSGEMAVAYWMSHFRRSPFPLLNGGDAAILFCFVFLYIAAAGPGPWSLDAARNKTAA
jgi:putative oxidoreductase